MRRSAWRARPGRWAAAAVAACAVSVGGAWADGVKIGGFWYDNAEIVGFEDGLILYQLAGASRETELGKLEGLRVLDNDAVQQGEAALAEGEAAEAVELLTQAVRDARQPWAKTYAGWRLMQAQAAAGDARAATTAWLALAEADVDPYFLADPPVDAVRSADDNTKRSVLTQLDRVRRPPAGATEGIAALRTAAESAADSASTPAAKTADQSSASSVVLPSAIPTDDPVARLLAAGDYAAAAAAAQAELASSGGLAKNLYLLGRAQLARAEATGDEAAFLDAGLSFMKAAIYFPRGRYTGFALAEAGRVHDAIGRPDKAADLYRRAALLIDDQAEPDYAQRLTQLQEAPGG